MGSPKRFLIILLFLIVLLIAVGLVVFHPNWFIAALARRSPTVIYFVETPEPVVALTIDDGPDPVSTVKILDLLGRHQAKATFFLISQRVAGNEEIVRRSVSEGHELANHMTTDEPTIKLKSAEFERQLVEAHQVLTRFSEVRWFRPGSGWYNEKMLSILRQYDYQCALGSVYPFDPHIPSAWFIRHHVLRKVRPGSIIVLHDGGSQGKRTIEVLTRILPELKNRGFGFVTLSELVKIGKQDYHLPNLREVSYALNWTRLLSTVSWRVEPGEHWAILGPNEAGKTTLLRIICGCLWTNAGGEVYRKGESLVDLGLPRRSIGRVTATRADGIPVQEPVLDVEEILHLFKKTLLPIISLTN